MVATRSQTRASAPSASGDSPRTSNDDAPEIALPMTGAASGGHTSSRAAAIASPKLSKGTVQETLSGSDEDDDLPKRKPGVKAKAAESKIASDATSTKPVTKKKAKSAGGKAPRGKVKVTGTTSDLLPSDATTDQSNHILGLPAELRNDIWTMVLVQDNEIRISEIRPFLKEPALLAVSRQVRSETMSIWYAENEFKMMGSSPAVKFLRSRNDQQLRSMRALNISCEASKTPREFLRHLRNKIEIMMREFEPRGFRRKALRFCLLVDATMKWINGEELRNFEVDGPADKYKKIRGGPRKGEKVAGAESKDDIAD